MSKFTCEIRKYVNTNRRHDYIANIDNSLNNTSGERKILSSGGGRKPGDAVRPGASSCHSSEWPGLRAGAKGAIPRARDPKTRERVVEFPRQRPGRSLRRRRPATRDARLSSAGCDRKRTSGLLNPRGNGGLGRSVALAARGMRAEDERGGSRFVLRDAFLVLPARRTE